MRCFTNYITYITISNANASYYYYLPTTTCIDIELNTKAFMDDYKGRYVAFKQLHKQKIELLYPRWRHHTTSAGFLALFSPRKSQRIMSSVIPLSSQQRAARPRPWRPSSPSPRPRSPPVRPPQTHAHSRSLLSRVSHGNRVRWAEPCCKTVQLATSHQTSTDLIDARYYCMLALSFLVSHIVLFM